MKLNKVQNMSKNVISGVIFRCITTIFPFIIRTIIIKVLSSEYLGLSSLFTAVLQGLNLMELGIGSALVYNMYAPVAKGDKEKIANYMMFYRKCYRIIGFAILLIGLVLLPFIKLFISGTYPDEVNIYILFVIYLLNTVFDYMPLAYKNSIALAYQRNDVQTKSLIVSRTLMYTTQILVLIFFKNYYMFAVIMPIFTLIKNFVISHKIDKMYPDIKPSGDITEEEKTKVNSNVKSLIGHQVAGTVINSADNIVISMLLGLNSLAIYNNYYLILASLINIITIIVTSIQAGIGNSIIVDDKETLYNNFKKFRFFLYHIVLFMCICLCMVYQPFMKVWMGEDMLLTDLDAMIMIVGVYITSIRRAVTTYKNAAGLWKDDLLKPYIWIAADIILDIILIPKLGVSGAMLATIISCIIVALPVEIHVLFKKLLCHKEIEQYAFMLKEFSLFAICMITGLTIQRVTNFEDIVALVIYSIISILLIGIVILYIRNNPEFKWMRQRLKILIKHKK